MENDGFKPPMENPSTNYSRRHTGADCQHSSSSQIIYRHKLTHVQHLPCLSSMPSVLRSSTRCGEEVIQNRCDAHNSKHSGRAASYLLMKLCTCHHQSSQGQPWVPIRGCTSPVSRHHVLSSLPRAFRV